MRSPHLLLRLAALAILTVLTVLLAPSAAAQQTFTVTTTADDGAGSLRAAIASANATPELDTIAFAIDGGGSYQQIVLDSALFVYAPIVLDGGTQGCDTSAGLCIGLDGDTGPNTSTFYGIELLREAAGSTIRGIAFTRFGRVADAGGARSGALALDTSDHVIAGNYFGTDRTGMVTDPDGTPDSGDELGNGFGIVVESQNERTVANVEIGQPGEGNVFAGSVSSVILLLGDHITGARVRGNLIGVASDSTTILGNFKTGVLFDSVGTVGAGNWVGGEEDGEGNLIVGSGVSGVLVTAADSTHVYGNVVSGNDFGGIQLQDGTSHATVRGNLVGLAPDAETALPNGTLAGLARFEGFGIALISGASENVIEGNVVSGNLLGGILLGGLPPGAVRDNIVTDNLIGLGADGEEAVPNGIAGVEGTGAGIVVFGAADEVSGSEIYGNVIGGNTTAGIVFDGPLAAGNLISDNLIGITRDEEPVPNGQAGILVRNGAQQNLIGASIFTEPNVIAYNPVSIALDATAGTGNIVAANILAASLFNIDLGTDGPTANDAGDADEGPNRLQNTPVISAATFSGSTLTLTYSVDTAPANAVYPLALQLYGVAPGDGDEPTQFIPLSLEPIYGESDAQQTVTQSFELSPDEVPPSGQAFIVAAVIDAAGNTSEVTTVPVTVAAEEGEDAAEWALTLAPNAPNPAASTTRIAYTLPEAGPVRLDVYDLLGRHVASLVDAVQPGGEHAVDFDATALPSGVYAYQLRTARGAVSRMMTLVR